jgi:hypothetical protein
MSSRNGVLDAKSKCQPRVYLIQMNFIEDAEVA